MSWSPWPWPLAEVVGLEPFGEIQPCLPRGPYQAQRKVPVVWQCSKQGSPRGQGARPPWTPLPASQLPTRPREPGVGCGVAGRSGRLTLAEGLSPLRSAGLSCCGPGCVGGAPRPRSVFLGGRPGGVRHRLPGALRAGVSGARVPRRLLPEAPRRQQLVSQTRQPREGVRVSGLAEHGSGPAPAPRAVCKRNQNVYDDAAQSCRLLSFKVLHREFAN